MKKIAFISFLLAFMASVFAQAVNTPAADDVATLTKKVAELEKQVKEADETTDKIVEKYTDIIGKLRNENKELKQELERYKTLAAAGLKNAPANPDAKLTSSQAQLKAMQMRSAEIRKNADKIDKDIDDDIAAELGRMGIDKNTNPEPVFKDKTKEKEEKAKNAEEDKKDKSFWDSVFPF